MATTKDVLEILQKDLSGDKLIVALDALDGIEQIDFNERVGPVNPRSGQPDKLIVTALSGEKIVEFLSSKIGGELTETQANMLFAVVLESVYLKPYMKIPRVDRKVKLDAQFIKDNILGTVVDLGYGIFSDQDITSKFAPLTKDEAIAMALEALVARESWFCTIFEHLPVVEKLNVNDTVTMGPNTMHLLDIASMRHMASYFLQYATGKVDPNIMVLSPEKFKLFPASAKEARSVPLALSIMFESCNGGPRIFKKVADAGKFEGTIDIGNAFGVSILYYAILGGREQFEALAKCGIVGELGDFNQTVEKIPDGEINILETLVAKAAKEGLLPEFLNLLEGLDEGQDCHLKLDGEELKNQLDLGMHAGDKTLYEHLTFPDHNDLVLFFDRNKKLAINLAGPDIQRILKYMTDNPFFRKVSDGGMGCMVKASCWDMSEKPPKKIFDAISVVTKAESLKPGHVLDRFAIDCIKVGALMDTYPEQAGPTPYGPDMLLTLEPVMPNDAQKTELGGEAGFGDGADLAA